MFTDLMGTEKTLQIVVDYLNYYSAYIENRIVFGNEFQDIILNPNKTNFKVNPILLERAVWIDDSCTDISKNCGKKITIDGKDIWLSDLGNIGLGYLAEKQGYSLRETNYGALFVSLIAGDLGKKKEGVIKNEVSDRPYYSAGYQLSSSIQGGQLTKNDLLNAFFNVLPNGR